MALNRSDKSRILRRPPAGHGGVDFRADGKDHIRQREPGPSHPLRRLRDGITQLPQQLAKDFLFVGLRRVVGGPVPPVGHSHGLGLDGGTVGPFLPLDDKLDGVDVLAGLLTPLEVGARAEGFAVDIDHVRAVAGLGRDLIAEAVLINADQGGYRHAPLLASGVAVVGVSGAKGCNWLVLRLGSYHPLPSCPLMLTCTYNTILCMVLQADGVSPNVLDRLYTVWYCPGMSEVQERLASLQQKGWTLAAIADELGVTKNAVEKWKAGHREPSNAKGVFQILDHLMKRKQVPKQRRYTKPVQNDTGQSMI